MNRDDPDTAGGRGRAACVVLGLLLLPAAGAAQPTALRGATIVDGTGRAPIAAGVVVIESGRLACVGRAADCPPPPGARIVEVADRWIVPGLIDGHVHLDFEAEARLWEVRQRLRFMFGLTTTRDAGTPRGSDDPEARGRLDEARSRGAAPDEPLPRLVVAALFAEAGAPPSGADAVAIAGGAEPDEIRDAIGLARREGLPVYLLGVPGRAPAAVAAALEAGVDGISGLSGLVESPGPPEHWSGPSGAWLEPLLSSLVRRVEPYRIPVPLIGVVELPRALEESRYPGSVGLDADSARLAALVARGRARVAAWHEAGGRLVAGSDDLPVPGLALHQELEALVEAGLPPGAALAAATRHAARALGVADSLGTLEVGKRADLLILEADPLAEIGNTVRIETVVKGGRAYDVDALFNSLRRSGMGRMTTSRGRSLVALGIILLAALAGALAIARHRRRARGG